MALAFPDIDPVAVRLGGVTIRWYALAYLSGLLLGWYYLRQLVKHSPFTMTALQVDDLLFWVTMGVILGGRCGYIVFYNIDHYLANPLDIAALWRGGMSFHGGVAGVIMAVILFAKRNGLSSLAVGDLVCTAEPIGQFFGRIANFVNGELFGRPAASDIPWAVIFPHSDGLPRHPSQIYEAGLEGLVLFFLLYFVWRQEKLRCRTGFISGIFFFVYAMARIAIEYFREPDIQLGYLAGGLTMGQILSVPLLVFGVLLIFLAKTSQR